MHYHVFAIIKISNEYGLFSPSLVHSAILVFLVAGGLEPVRSAILPIGEIVFGFFGHRRARTSAFRHPAHRRDRVWFFWSQAGVWFFWSQAGSNLCVSPSCPSERSRLLTSANLIKVCFGTDANRIRYTPQGKFRCGNQSEASHML